MPDCVITMDYRPGLKYLLTILLFALLPGRSIAQVAYHNFNSNDGLPSNEVYCSLQDHDGFMWFGTDHGVVKYNGYNFKTYTTADGLTDNTVLLMKEDDEHNIWFLTLTGGMCYFDGKKFAPHPYNDTIKFLCNRRIPMGYEILAHKQIWLSFVEQGIAKVDTNKYSFFTYGGPQLNNDSVHVYVIHLAGSKTIYTSFLAHKMPEIKDPAITGFDNYNISFNFLLLNQLNFHLLSFQDKSMLIAQGQHLIFIDKLGKVHPTKLPDNTEVLNLQTTADRKNWMLLKN